MFSPRVLNLLVVSSLLLLIISCGNDDASTDTGSDTDTDTDTDSDADGDPEAYCDTDFDPDSPTPIPQSGHSGWQNAGCFKSGCHAEDALPSNHPPGMVPGHCPACHMRNGSQERPADSDHQDPESGCSCHGDADLKNAGHIPIEQFNSETESCANCHPYCP